MSPASDRLQAGLVLLLATGAGLAVASLYYNQPMLGLLGAELRAGAAALGWVPTLTQLGYAAGILLLAPLGDRYDRKRIILAKAGALILALLLAAAAPSLGVLLAASFAIGLSATLAQDIAAIALLALALWRGLPRFAPTSALPYRHLLASLGALWRRHPELRRAALAQGLLSLGFSAFWSTLAVMLHGAPFHLGAESAGAFGLAGAAGALAAPLAGRQADRRGPAAVGRLGAGLTALSFAAMLALPWLPGTAGLWLIALATLGFDLGIQMALIAHQSMVYSIEPAARSRLNAVLMVSVFIGMAAGGALGSIMLARWGWTGVTLLATAAALGALALRLAAPARAYAA